MQIAARTAAWAKSGYTAKDYVQDGLVAMWDGIENAGWGVHDPNATVWKDLAGSMNLDMKSYGTWGDDSVICSGLAAEASYSLLDVPEAFEIVLVRNGGGNRNCALYIGEYDSNGRCSRMFMIIGSELVQMHSSSSKYTTKQPLDRSSYYVDYESSLIDSPVNSIFKNGVDVTSSTNYSNGWPSTDYSNGKIQIGCGYDANRKFTGNIFCVRLYSRKLNENERAANYAIDKVRFNLT